MGSDSYIQSLLRCNPIREAIIPAMIRELQLPPGSSGLDAGCGIGLHCLLFASEVGPAGHITGLDVSTDMLTFGRKIIEEKGLSKQIAFQEGSVTSLPFNDDSFDWVWSADCVGYAPLEPLHLLKEMARVVKPGGTVAIAAWSSEKLLPGYPRLEARLGATASGIAPFLHGKRPELHFQRALGWFHELELKEASVKVYADSFHAPLTDKIRNALAALIDMRWPCVTKELSLDDLAEYQRLCLPDSPDFILNLPDYCAFFTYTMFHGRKAG